MEGVEALTCEIPLVSIKEQNCNFQITPPAAKISPAQADGTMRWLAEMSQLRVERRPASAGGSPPPLAWLLPED
jgi:hypothetical protein